MYRRRQGPRGSRSGGRRVMRDGGLRARGHAPACGATGDGPRGGGVHLRVQGRERESADQDAGQDGRDERAHRVQPDGARRVLNAGSQPVRRQGRRQLPGREIRPASPASLLSQPPQRGLPLGRGQPRQQVDDNPVFSPYRLGMHPRRELGVPDPDHDANQSHIAAVATPNSLLAVKRAPPTGVCDSNITQWNMTITFFDRLPASVRQAQSAPATTLLP